MQTSSATVPGIASEGRAGAISRVSRAFRTGTAIAFIVASALAAAPAARAEEAPPPGLAKRVALRADQTRKARDNYTYRQTVKIEEMGPRGGAEGEYREVREVIFSPQGERTERLVGTPVSRLKRLILTEEDFRDVREVQPFLFTPDQLWSYQIKFRGEEAVNGVSCWVLDVRPRQILAGQRFFEGLLWVRKTDASIVRSMGQAVPQLRGSKQENLFPHFTTEWQEAEGGYCFPAYTVADDTLDFRTGPVRERLTIRYTDYKRFGAESTLKFGGEVK